MKKKSIRAFAFCVVLFCLCACTENEPAQTQSVNNAWPWPDSLEALHAAPNNHKVILENERVRVLEVTINPHEKEPVHGHRWPSVLYIDKAGDFVDYDHNGNVLVDSRRAAAPLQYPITQWLPPQAPHAVENLSEVSVHLIRVELKR